MIRVFITHNAEDLDAYYGRALPQLQSMTDVAVNETGRNLTTDELIEAAADTHVIVSHRSTPGEPALFESSPELLAFLRCAVDVSNIDVDAAGRAGVLVACADKSFVASTAELALALMLDVARRVSDSTIAYRNGSEPPQRSGSQLAGSTAGIIGYGAIGAYLAAMLSSLDMKVLVHDPHTTVTDPRFRQVEFAELLGLADWVLPLAPAVAETADLIGQHELAQMKPDAYLVNVSRGELIDEAAVAEALETGHLAGFAMDVGRGPDQRPSLDLASRPGVVATPHLGGLTPQNADAQAASSVEQVRAILSGRTPPRSLNPNAATRLHNFWANESADHRRPTP